MDLAGKICFPIIILMSLIVVIGCIEGPYAPLEPVQPAPTESEQKNISSIPTQTPMPEPTSVPEPESTSEKELPTYIPTATPYPKFDPEKTG